MRNAVYQPEIDGLRAIAVLGVLLFHLRFDLLPGGFVGVDVFFVISGFLITRLIAAEFTESGSFSFSHFYMRRVKRLFPALFVTLLLTLVVGVLVLPSAALERLGLSTVHSLLSISNFFFWSESGYFDVAASSKPLLHTWSLSVEEQFYLIWPISLIILLSFSSRLRWLSPSLFIACFFGASLYVAEAFYADASTAVFFLTPFRAYEFMLGAALVWLPSLPKGRQLPSELLQILGLSLIIYSMRHLTTSSSFPGMSALPATIGAALSIYAADARWSGLLLRNKVMVSVGLISYSLYLVHWPLIVYYEYLSNTIVGLSSGLLLGLSSLIAAAAMYQFVEKPFRRRASQNSAWLKQPSAVGLVASVLLILLIYPATLLMASEGWPERLDNSLAAEINTKQVPSYQTWKLMKSLERAAFRGETGPNVLLVGDSQAADFLNILSHASLNPAMQVSTVTVDVWCGALVLPKADEEAYFRSNKRVQDHKNSVGMQGHCRGQWKRWLASPLLQRADYVVLSSLWYDYQLPYLEGTIEALGSATDAEVLLVGNKSLPLDSLELATRCGLLSFALPIDCGRSIEAINRFAARYLKSGIKNDNSDYLATNTAMKDIAQSSGALFIDLYTVLCGKELASCTVFDEAGTATFKDYAHVNKFGARIFANRLSVNSTLPEALLRSGG